jgi:hypothetical protein
VTCQPRALRLALSLAFGLAACHTEKAPAPTPSAPGERELLLAKIAALDEVAPCLAGGGPSGLRLVDAELAGDAAHATFDCANHAVRGKVTFFRIAGSWTISTKEITSR